MNFFTTAYRSELIAHSSKGGSFLPSFFFLQNRGLSDTMSRNKLSRKINRKLCLDKISITNKNNSIRENSSIWLFNFSA